MKRNELMKRLARIAKASGRDLLITEGGRHTRVQIGIHVAFVPRHGEINEITAGQIIKQAKGEK